MHRISWSLLPFFYLVCTCCCLPDGDLCRWMNGRKYYIDVDESGIISAENVTSQSKPASVDQPQIPQRCSVELVTCSSCHFQIFATRINIPTCSSDNTCRCDFVWVKESAYSKSGQELCGVLSNSSSLIFESKTKQVSVHFLYTGPYDNAFALHFRAIKNVYVFKGGFDYYQGNTTGVFGSPNFPNAYPNDYSAVYILQNVDPTGFVQLLFTDFQLSLWSYMEILDSNGSRIDVYNGNTFRPPTIISSGPSLTIKFQANEEYPSSGFLATYTFVGYSEKYWLNRPSTDCGGFVEDYGGAITMMNMMKGNTMRVFDCIWLIRPRTSGPTEKQVSVRVAQFEDMGAKSTLTIRQGLYSNAPILETVSTFQHHKLHRGHEYVVAANRGFYIRLNGYFKNKSHLAIVYSAFQYEECFAVVDFECSNGRCIKNSLRCDGFNHCGDGSDESSCYGSNPGTQSPEDMNWWRTLTPNYYFPKSDSSNSAGTNTLILVTSLAGLGMFVLTTVVILVKLHKQRQDDTISREILQTISADIEAENAAHQHQGGSDPPVYDPPPSYDDVVKFYQPPPPAYSRVGPNRGNASRNPTETHAPQSPRSSRTRGRRVKSTKQIPVAHEPAILQVTLPEVQEETRNTRHSVHRLSSGTSTGETRASSHVVAIQPYEGQTTAETTNGVDERTSCSSQQRKPVLQRGLQALHHYKSILEFVMGDGNSCDCQGACSCSTKSRPRVEQSKRGPFAARGLSIDINKIGKSQSFKHESSIDESLVAGGTTPVDDSCSICDSPGLFNSGPQHPSTDEYYCEDSSTATNAMSGHRRTSSAPSDSCDESKTKGSSKHRTNDKYLDPNDSKQLSHVAEISKSPDVCSFNNRTSPKSVEDNEKDLLPTSWGSLWNQVRQKSDMQEVAKSTHHSTWMQSDTQPLISKLCPSDVRGEISSSQKSGRETQDTT